MAVPRVRVTELTSALGATNEQEGNEMSTSTIKARRADFHDCIDTEEMFQSFFANLRKDRVIP